MASYKQLDQVELTTQISVSEGEEKLQKPI